MANIRKDSDPNPNRKVRKGLYISRVNLHILKKRILHVINSDVLRMVEAVGNDSLQKADQEAAIKYGKFIDDLLQEQAKAEEAISDEEIKKALAGSD